MTCATCVFWQLDEDDRVYDHIFAPYDPMTYDPIPQEYEVRYCKRAKSLERPERNGSAVVDGSEYFAALVTGPDFSCNQWSGARPSAGETPT